MKGVFSLLRTVLAAILALLLAPAAISAPGDPGMAPPIQRQPRPLSVTVHMVPSTPREGDPVRFKCVLRNESAGPRVVVRADLEANAPGLSRSWSFVGGPLQVDALRRDGPRLQVERRRLYDVVRPEEARLPREPRLEGSRPTDLVELLRVLAPGETLQVEFSGQAVPLTGDLLDATLRVESLPPREGPVWVPRPGPRVPLDPPAGEREVRVVQDFFLRTPPLQVAPGDLVSESWLEGSEKAEYRLLVPVASGPSPLGTALGRAGLVPGKLADAAWLGAAGTWALEASGAPGSVLVVGTRAVPYPGPSAAWFRELSLRGEPAELRASGPPAEVGRILRGLPGREVKGGRAWTVPLADLPGTMLELLQVGWRVEPGGQVVRR